MSGIEKDLNPTEQVELARKAFEQEFERFVRLTDYQVVLTAALTLEEALVEQRALAEVRTRHLGKKSALNAARKLIGKVAADERPAFGQLVQPLARLIELRDVAQHEAQLAALGRDVADADARGSLHRIYDVVVHQLQA